MDYFGADLEIKTVDVQQRLISGYAAAHHNIDRVKDIIDPSASVKAMKRLGGKLSDVGTFIGHDTSQLPVGIPQRIEATPQGLYTETYVLKGPAGDNLLAVAKDLMDHGQSLGMSIGYKTHDSRRESAGGKMVRRIMDYELKEYSFAAHQAIANPSALVHAVKSNKENTMDDEQAQEEKAEWSTATVNDLPDSSFLYISPGGDKDEEGKTTPRSLRHFPYRDAKGAIDLPHLRNAIARIPQANIPAEAKTRLQARARRLLENANGGKTVTEDAAWQAGAAVEVRALGYALIDLSDELAEESKAMQLLGEETKGYSRIRAEMRGRIGAVARDLSYLLEAAARIDKGEDGKAQVERRRRELALLDL